MESPNNKKILKSDPDRISSLHDALLHHILSSLDMKEVVQTSLLSSRWRYLWVSLPLINCNHSLWKMEDKFRKFVDRVLLLRDGSDIKRLQICCPSYYNSDCLGAWITSAVRKHLQEIHLQFCPDRQIELPWVVFSLGIAVLELNLASTDKSVIYIKIPNLICSMSKLTTLILMFVELPPGNSSGELVFSFPVLENLTMIECCDKHLKAVTISTPQLKTIVIKNKYNIWNENFRITNLSVLVSAMIRYDFTHEVSMVQLLEDISCAKTIDLYCKQFLEDGDSCSNEPTSTSSDLRCLKLTVANIYSPWLVFMLKKFPCMETLVLLISGDDSYQPDLFTGINYHLKYVEIGWLTGNEDNYKCLQTLLKNVPTLEKLVIRMSKAISHSKMETFGQRILSLFKASSRVAILYYGF